MLRFHFVRIGFLFLFILSPLAQGAKIALVGVGSSSVLKSTPGTYNEGGVSLTSSGSAKTAFGGGALVGMMMGQSFELESGILYISRKWNTTTTVIGLSDITTFTTHALSVPVLLRAHLHRFFSIGVGGYFNHGMGNVKQESDGGISGKASTLTATYSDAELKKNDYGALASLAFRLPLSARTSLVLDGRYAMGLSDVNTNPGSTTPAVVEKYTDMQALLGLQFGM